MLVADDQAVIRKGFVGMLHREPDFRVIGEASDGSQAVQQAASLLPDAILIDLEIPKLDGIEATRRIKECHPEIAVIGLSFRDHDSSTRAMVEAGAYACVPKHAPAKELVDLLRGICSRRPLSGSDSAIRKE